MVFCLIFFIRNHQYLTLKVCTSNKRLNNEISISDHLKDSGIEHPGKPFVRVVLDSFNITSSSGNCHQYLLYQPLGMSFAEFLDLLPENKFPEDLLQRSMQLILVGLGYLHQANVVHTGKHYHPCNPKSVHGDG